MPDISEIDVSLLSSGDLKFLQDKEDTGDLISIISNEFSGNGDQINYVVPTGKIFYLVSAKLYPVDDVVNMTVPNQAIAYLSRRADIELTFNSVLKDVLTYFFQSVNGTNLANTSAQGSAGVAGKLETNARGISLTGDNVKAVKLTSTNVSGTYRVSLLGYLKDA